ITQISAENQKLTGDLIVEDYPLLKKIELKNHHLNSLTVINCPNLQHVNVRDNGLTILDLSKVKIDMDKKGVESEVKEIIASQNNLTILDLTNCQQVQELLVADNADLKELKNLNQTFLKNFNLINTQIDLEKEKQTLRQRNDYLFDIIKGVNEMGKDRGLALSDLIVSPEQNEEAIKRLLIKTRNRDIANLKLKPSQEQKLDLYDKLQQTPQAVKERISELEEKLKQMEQEKGDKIKELETKLEEANNKYQQTAADKDKEIRDVKELDQAKQEYENLSKRPDLPITSQKFWDDYVYR
ncbi:10715_t:CDS:2, partial [Racocetra persica]